MWVSQGQVRGCGASFQVCRAARMSPESSLLLSCLYFVWGNGWCLLGPQHVLTHHAARVLAPSAESPARANRPWAHSEGGRLCPW